MPFPLHPLPSQGLRDRVYSSNDLYVVLVLENQERCGEECEKYVDTLSRAEKQSGGLLRAGLLRAGGTVTVGKSEEEEPVHSLFNVTHVPSLLLWSPGGGPRSEMSALLIPAGMADHLLTAGAKALYEGLVPFVPSVLTAPLRSPGFPSFFGTTDPECCPGRLSPVVLLHASARPSPTLKRLALEYIGRAHFALVPASDTAALAAWGLQDNSSLPLMLVGPRGAGLPASAAAGGSGSGKKQRVADAAASSSAPYLPPPGSLHAQGWTAFPKDRNMTLAALSAWLNATLPPAAVPQLRSQADFERAQLASGVMLVGVLQGSSPEAAAREARILASVAGSWELVVPDFESLQGQGGFAASRPHASWSWVDGAAQAEWAGAFGASPPALLAFNPRKQLYAVMKGAFSEGNIADFVKSVPGLLPMHPKAAHLGVKPVVDVRLERLQRALPAMQAQVSQEDLAAALGGGKKKKQQQQQKAAAADL